MASDRAPRVAATLRELLRVDAAEPAAGFPHAVVAELVAGLDHGMGARPVPLAVWAQGPSRGAGADEGSRPDHVDAALSAPSFPSVIVVGNVPVRMIDALRWTIVLGVGARLRAGLDVPRAALAEASRTLAELLAARHPGKAIEVRVPPFTAVQIGDGGPAPVHTRGTPPSVIETDPVTFVALLLGDLTWDEALSSHSVRASGAHSNLGALLPLVR